jgi:Zn-dependent protease with chaperone function
MEAHHLEALENSIRSIIPEFEIRKKADSRVMRILGTLFRPIAPTFMTDYYTTWFGKVYVPSDPGSVDTQFQVIAHEFVHLWDEKQHPLWWRFSYILPQVLILPIVISAIAAFWLAWWLGLALLVAGVLVFVLPSPWRTKWELRGYTMSLAVALWRGWEPSLDFYIRQFTGWTYLRMSWSPDRIERRLQEALRRIRSGGILSEEPYRIVHKVLQEQGLLRG